MALKIRYMDEQKGYKKDALKQDKSIDSYKRIKMVKTGGKRKKLKLLQPQVRLQDIRKPTINKSRRRRKTVSKSLKSLIKAVPDAKTPVIVFPNVSSFRSVANKLPGAKKKITKAFLQKGGRLVQIEP